MDHRRELAARDHQLREMQHESFAYFVHEVNPANGLVRDKTAADWQNTKAFAEQGLQIAAGVPLALDEGPDFRTFRVGLFGLDKLKNVDRTVATFERALNAA